VCQHGSVRSKPQLALLHVKPLLNNIALPEKLVALGGV
jgi:hypothetical protein